MVAVAVHGPSTVAGAAEAVSTGTNTMIANATRMRIVFMGCPASSCSREGTEAAYEGQRLPARTAGAGLDSDSVIDAPCSRRVAEESAGLGIDAEALADL